MTKALIMEKIDGKPGQVYYPIKVVEVPTPSPKANELQVQIQAAALNHRDFFLRQHLYPAPSFSTPFFADGTGIVTAIGSSADKFWLGKRVILTPGRGWTSDPDGPEEKYAILGGTSTFPLGTGQEILCVAEDEVEECPAHLSPAEGAAFPLVGLTGWRALVSKSGNARAGRNVLITGIGGGVALSVLQFAVSLGMNAYVTSGDQEKIDKAVKIGAKGGVSYKTVGWEKELMASLPKDRPYIDTIIDGAGGNITSKAVKLLKFGGTVVQYGMTVSPKMDWTMAAVLKNIELRGSTMGSRKEFKEMVQFVNEKQMKPIVSRIAKGGLSNLKEINELFDEIRDGRQFGKLVIEVSPEASSSKL
ncbi:zinc-binding dehydrogenase [Amylocarpus encephaloides]|uniref:Zinc-binding dehydrogenase n=1 Tax=Amylocarpus encephaloides TaxID=45428 RepID=A0A9P8C4E3_9HELO|nr:zinc-binding dehydrogenase [Amylocarpus encephaloides]